MLGFQADAGGRSHFLLPVYGAERAVALGRPDRGAGAFGDILERAAVEVLARRARAGRAGAGGAIVLAGERDAEALLLARLRLHRRGDKGGRSQRGSCTGNGDVSDLHGQKSPWTRGLGWAIGPPPLIPHQVARFTVRERISSMRERYCALAGES